jgi:tetratricopeptide (TPR) repeat protein
MGASSWRRLALMNNRKRWRYVGVLHETPICDDASGPPGHLGGNYYCAAGTEGARSRNPSKYAMDAEVLARAYDQPALDTWLQHRYAFYCAQSYRDAEMHYPALEWYQKRVELGGWVQELYVSRLNAGWLLRAKGRVDEAIKCWLAACDYGLPRYEALSEVAQHYQMSGLAQLAKALYDQVDVSRVGVYEDQLFLHQPLHQYILLCDMLLCYARCKAYARAAVVLTELLGRWDRIGSEWRGAVLHNAWYVSSNHRLSTKCLRLAIACADSAASSTSPPPSLDQMRSRFSSALAREVQIAAQAVDGIVANVYSFS